MGKLMVGLGRFLLLCTVLLVLPSIAAAQCVSKLAVQRVWTQDASGTDKATFVPGGPIRYAAQLNNSYGAYLLAANGTRVDIITRVYTVTDTKPVDIPPGVSMWTWNATAPSTEGSYIVTIKAYDHFCGVWVERSSSFTIGQGTGTTVTLERALTHNSEGDIGQEQTTFTYGEVIRYAAIVNNPGSSTVTPKFDFQVTGPHELFSWTGDVSIAPGRWYFHLHTSVPNDAPVGSYTLRVTMTYNGKTSIQERSFRVTLIKLPVSRQPEGKASNLIVLVHGCCTDANEVRNEWDYLGNLIAETIIRNRTPGTWEIVVLDWTRCTSDPNIECTPKLGPQHLNPFDEAYDNAEKRGHDLATAILNVKNRYLHVHLIAHSAGANLIDTVATDLYIKSIETGHKPFIHLTFLDAYTPLLKSDQFTYGTRGDYAEHYVDRSGVLPVTDELLNYAFNFDITHWINAVKGDITGHQWPRYWYEESVTSTSPKFKYGFPLSLEGGGGIDRFNELASKWPKSLVGDPSKPCILEDETTEQPPSCAFK